MEFNKTSMELSYLARSRWLSENIKQQILLDSGWIDVEITSKINELINEVKQYYKYETANYNQDDGIFVYEGHFEKISSVSKMINDNARISNLKSVKIYATHSLIIDEDYKIEAARYVKTKNAPDLIIITPILTCNKSVIINLSCDIVPEDPIVPKARNGVTSGNKGDDGYPGLPGYNGGSLFISAINVSIEKMTFISKGGKGGKGQNGMFIFFICMKYFFCHM